MKIAPYGRKEIEMAEQGILISSTDTHTHTHMYIHNYYMYTLRFYKFYILCLVITSNNFMYLDVLCILFTAVIVFVFSICTCMYVHIYNVMYIHFNF